MVGSLVLDSPVGALCIRPPHGFMLDGVAWQDEAVVAQVRVRDSASTCPNCGRHDAVRYGHGTISILDAPSGGVRAKLSVARQRLECRLCNVISRERLPQVSDGHRFTDRCASWMESQIGLRTYADIGDVLGINKKSVERFAAEQGLSKRKRRLGVAQLQCCSCLRLLEPALGDIAHFHHPPPDAPVRAGVLMCDACHADDTAVWITRL